MDIYLGGRPSHLVGGRRRYTGVQKRTMYILYVYHVREDNEWQSRVDVETIEISVQMNEASIVEIGGPTAHEDQRISFFF